MLQSVTSFNKDDRATSLEYDLILSYFTPPNGVSRKVIWLVQPVNYDVPDDDWNGSQDK